MSNGKRTFKPYSDNVTQQKNVINANNLPCCEYVMWICMGIVINHSCDAKCNKKNGEFNHFRKSKQSYAYEKVLESILLKEISS